MEYLAALALMGGGYYLSNKKKDLMPDTQVNVSKNTIPSQNDIYSSYKLNDVKNEE